MQLAKLAVAVLLFAATGSCTRSQTLVINGQNGTVITGQKISSTTGDCIQILNSTNITVQASNIGPCAGKSVLVSGGSGISIFDNYIHPEHVESTATDKYDGIFAINTSNFTAQGNVFAYSESNLYHESVNGSEIKGNFFLNPLGPFPRGQNFKAAKGGSAINHNITFEDNYAFCSKDTTKYLFACNQEDSVNFGTTTGVTARNNFIEGGFSSSGCGLIADFAANSATFSANLLHNTGQCGIGIASGTNQLVDSNKVYNDLSSYIPGAGNTAIHVSTHYSVPCGPVTVSNNIADQLRPNGGHSGYFKGVGCNPTTTTGNTFGAPADPLLTPFPQAPLIPPVPKNCVAVSPYTTQVGTPCAQ